MNDLEFFIWMWGEDWINHGREIIIWKNFNKIFR